MAHGLTHERLAERDTGLLLPGARWSTGWKARVTFRLGGSLALPSLELLPKRIELLAQSIEFRLQRSDLRFQ